MNINPQIIKQNGEPAFVVLPIKDYEIMLQAIQDNDDIDAIQEYLDSPNETFPIKVVLELGKGESPIKVFRKHRGLSQVELAKKVDVSKQYISQIENNEREGSSKVLKVIAKVLGVSVDDLI